VVLNRGSTSAPAPAVPPSTAPRVEVAVEVRGIVRAGEGCPRDPGVLAGRRVALLSAIGRPARFADTARALGAEVVHEQHHRDHAWLTDADVARFLEGASRAGAELRLTTEKDAVRLPVRALGALDVLAVAHRVVAGEAALDAALAPFGG
jgi:tetraacyldisaccharide-1-P 4'-kinase